MYGCDIILTLNLLFPLIVVLHMCTLYFTLSPHPPLHILSQALVILHYTKVCYSLLCPLLVTVAFSLPPPPLLLCYTSLCYAIRRIRLYVVIGCGHEH